MRRRIKSILLASIAAIGLAAAPIAPANAFLLGGIVYDPTNHAQNLLTAARTLIMINNQVTQLTNEAQMIANQAKELANLPFSAKVALKSRLAEIDSLIKTAKGIAFDVATVDTAFKALFPEDYASYSNLAMAADARTHWQEASRALHDSMRMQARITETIAADATTLDELIQESQSAIGGLQAMQAGNQLIALQTKQSMQTAELLAVHTRAEAVARAKALQTEERARIHRERFIGDGAAYTKS